MEKDLEVKLLLQVKNGNKRSFEILFNHYYKKVYGYALKLLPTKYEAEEIVQNVFIAVWNQRSELENITSFHSYLFGIARHLVYRQIRQKIHQEAYIAYAIENNSDYSFVTEEEIFYKELENQFNQLIQQLPERRREIFVLSRKENLSYKEIASLLNISENTVDTQIRLALNYVKSGLNKLSYFLIDLLIVMWI